jgi:Zn-dependent protease with chaperone function
MFAAFVVGIICLVIYLVCRGGDKAFGQFMGVFLAIALVGALVIFGGGFILLFLLPLLLAVGIPIIFLAAVAVIIARFINALGSEKPASHKPICNREE